MRTASRSTGADAMIDNSRTPVSASCSVRGIGVALKVSTCTSARSCFSRSLWLTPKCCSSSTMRSPRSLNLIALPSSAWVPTTISIEPSVSPFLTRLSSLVETRREACATLTGKPLKRSAKVLACWRASKVVGTTTATCLPSSATANAARNATSVLPKPTSPQIRRSIGRPLSRSFRVAWIALSWSSVSS